MSKIECRRCFPSFELLDKIAFCLKKPVSKFLETEHIENREILLEELIQNLQDMPEEKFRQVYKIIQTFL